MAKWPYSTTRWQRLRTAKLGRNPTCEMCAKRGRLRGASHVDHIEAINAGGEPFPPLERLMSMCASCHAIKTNARDMPGRASGHFKGCDVNGEPLDPTHPFNETSGGGVSDHEGEQPKDRPAPQILS